MNITIIAMAIISGPSPIFASLFDLLGDGNAIPITILSNPIIIRAIETILIILFVVIPGYVRATTVKIMAIAPKPTSKYRSQAEDVVLSLLLLFEATLLVKHHLPY